MRGGPSLEAPRYRPPPGDRASRCSEIVTISLEIPLLNTGYLLKIISTNPDAIAETGPFCGLMATLKQLIGKRIRGMRRARRNPDGRAMTISDLSEAIGSYEEVVGRIERGQVWPEYATLEKIAEALGVDLRDLFAHLPAAADTPQRIKHITALNNYATRLGDEDLQIAVGQLRVLAETRSKD